ncbi:MAG: PaaI family thioesterase [Candidatus Nanopelagicales bacterium]
MSDQDRESAFEAFADLVEESKRLLDAVAGSRPTPEASNESSQLIARAAAVLTGFAVSEDQQLHARITDEDHLVQCLIPAFHVDELSANAVVGSVRFDRYYLGAGGAVHGGAVPLLFDDVLGSLSQIGDRGRCRTAYLNVNYRSITPIETRLTVAARIERVDGRKVFVRGSVSEGPSICAEAEGLFVKLRPGQR